MNAFIFVFLCLCNVYVDAIFVLSPLSSAQQFVQHLVNALELLQSDHATPCKGELIPLQDAQLLPFPSTSPGTFARHTGGIRVDKVW